MYADSYIFKHLSRACVQIPLANCLRYLKQRLTKDEVYSVNITFNNGVRPNNEGILGWNQHGGKRRRTNQLDDSPWSLQTSFVFNGIGPASLARENEAGAVGGRRSIIILHVNI